MDRTVEEAAAYLKELTQHQPVSVTASGNAFSFEFTDLEKTALSVFGEPGEHDDEPIYTILDTFNEDDVGRYQEVLRYEHKPEGGKPGFHAEAYYSRPLLGSRQMGAQCEGKIWITSSDTHETMRQECLDAYLDRLTECSLQEIRETADLLHSIMWSANKASPESRRKATIKLSTVITEINRNFISKV